MEAESPKLGALIETRENFYFTSLTCFPCMNPLGLKGEQCIDFDEIQIINIKIEVSRIKTGITWLQRFHTIS